MFVRPGLNVVDCIHQNARFRGKHAAFVCGEERANWIEFSQRTNKVANALLRAGLKKETRSAFFVLAALTRPLSCLEPCWPEGVWVRFRCF